MKNLSETESRKRKQLPINNQIVTLIIEPEGNVYNSFQSLNNSQLALENIQDQDSLLPSYSNTNSNNMVVKCQNKIDENDSKVNDRIDYSLYSRQVYALGEDVMLNMAKTNVLVSGMDGLGVEIAKNLILGGFNCVDIHDTCMTAPIDLSTQYYLNESDIGKNRATCCYKHLIRLNNYVKISCHTEPIDESFFMSYSIVVIVNGSLTLIKQCSIWARSHHVKFIVANTRGVIGQIFCDLGDEFLSNNPTGEEYPLLLVSHITDDGYVSMLDRKRHGLNNGDFVSCTLTYESAKKCGKKMSPPLPIEVITPDSFRITQLPLPDDIQLAPGSCIKVAIPKTFHFLPFKQACIQPNFVISNFAKYELTPMLHIAMLSLLTYQQMYNSCPRPHNEDDAIKFVHIVREFNISGYVMKVENLNEDLLKVIAMQSYSQIAPIQAIIGGLTAQEVIKASSNKYTPINQWMYYDALELINNDEWKHSDPQLFNVTNVDFSKLNFRSLGQIALFGKNFQATIEQSSVFVVGAGAIGCELLKNLALMGVSCAPINTVNHTTPTISVTDMDVIERSNLSRQFLFRNDDIGKMKSSTAANAVRNINPRINIQDFQLRVCEETENIFDSKFYSKNDCILNALDNVDSRRYMDEKSITHCIPMIDGGTLGTCGNVQVVIPFVTESYSSSNDPEETSIPVCTLKHFPYLIEHAIQWARDQFEGVFKISPNNALNFLKNNEFFENTFKPKSFDYDEAIKTVYSMMISKRPYNFDDCIRLSRDLFEDFFVNSIKQLLFTLPPNHIGLYGQPFWLPPKRCPHPLKFDLHNELHFDFIISAANLLAYVYSIPVNNEIEYINQILTNYSPPEFKIDRSIVIHENEEEEERRLTSASNSLDDSFSIKTYLDELNNLDLKCRPITIRSIDFEKDDDTNYHMQFIYTCSNLRANNYDIENADYHKTKLIAGKIMPAIATTTAVVSGLECIELYKTLAKFDKIECYQNTFLNLAYNLLAGSEPCPPKYIEGVAGKFSFWDSIYVSETNNDGSYMTIADLINYIKDIYNLGDVCMINYGKKLLYAKFMKNSKERLDYRVRDIICSNLNTPINVLSKEFIIMECLVEDIDGEDCEIPFIKFVFGN